MEQSGDTNEHPSLREWTLEHREVTREYLGHVRDVFLEFYGSYLKACRRFDAAKAESPASPEKIHALEQEQLIAYRNARIEDAYYTAVRSKYLNTVLKRSGVLAALKEEAREERLLSSGIRTRRLHGGMSFAEALKEDPRGALARSASDARSRLIENPEGASKQIANTSSLIRYSLNKYLLVLRAPGLLIRHLGHKIPIPWLGLDKIHKAIEQNDASFEEFTADLIARKGLDRDTAWDALMQLPEWKERYARYLTERSRLLNERNRRAADITFFFNSFLIGGLFVVMPHVALYLAISNTLLNNPVSRHWIVDKSRVMVERFIDMMRKKLDELKKKLA